MKEFSLWEMVTMEGEGTGSEAAPAPVVTPTPPVLQPTWQEKRIAELTAKLHATRAEVQAFKAAQPEAQAQASPDLSELVAQQVEAQAFDRACNEVAAQGREAFGVTEFNSRVNDISSLVDRSDPREATRYNTFLQIAIETGEGARIIHALGGDKGEAARVLALPPGKMAVALAKMVAAKEKTKGDEVVEVEDEGKVVPGAKAAAEVAVSKAPKPITPLGSRSAPNTQIDPTDANRGAELDKKTWFLRREAQVAEARAAGRRMQ